MPRVEMGEVTDKGGETIWVSSWEVALLEDIGEAYDTIGGA